MGDRKRPYFFIEKYPTMSIEHDTTETTPEISPEENARLLAERQKRLIGTVVKGVLLKRRGGFFIKYTDEKVNNVFVTEDNVTRCLGDHKDPGMVAVVKCTIVAIGPSWKPWNEQHPVAKDVTLVTRYARKAKEGEDLDAKRAALGLAPLVVRKKKGRRHSPPRRPRIQAPRSWRVRSKCEFGIPNRRGNALDRFAARR